MKLTDKIEIYNSDCLNILPTIETESVDLVVTDPPYKIISGGCRKADLGDEPSGILTHRQGNKRLDWVDDVRTGKMFKENDIKFSEWIPHIFRVLKNKTHFYVMVNDRNMQEILNVCTENGFKLVNILIWKKNNCTPNRWYMKNAEFILMFRKGKARNINNLGSKTCLEINNIIGNKIHPTEKPIELLTILIENSSNKNELVLDPFMGGGSASVVCKKTDRRFIGIEKDEKYFTIAQNRLDNVSGIFKEDKLTLF
jgi:site-specific DNA-methyltransferase (adenine-specific)